MLTPCFYRTPADCASAGCQDCVQEQCEYCAEWRRSSPGGPTVMHFHLWGCLPYRQAHPDEHIPDPYPPILPRTA